MSIQEITLSLLMSENIQLKAENDWLRTQLSDRCLALDRIHRLIVQAQEHLT